MSNFPKFDSSTTPMAITAPIPAALSSMVSTLYSKNSHNSSSSNNSGSNTNKLHINSIKQFATKMTYKSHDAYQQPAIKTKNAKKYKCDLCGRGFSRSNTLITHRVSSQYEFDLQYFFCCLVFLFLVNVSIYSFL